MGKRIGAPWRAGEVTAPARSGSAARAVRRRFPPWKHVRSGRDTVYNGETEQEAVNATFHYPFGCQVCRWRARRRRDRSFGDERGPAYQRRARSGRQGCIDRSAPWGIAHAASRSSNRRMAGGLTRTPDLPRRSIPSVEAGLPWIERALKRGSYFASGPRCARIVGTPYPGSGRNAGALLYTLLLNVSFASTCSICS